MMSQIRRVCRVVYGAVVHDIPSFASRSRQADREQVLQSAAAVEERSREKVRRGSREVQQLAHSVIRKIEGHDNDPTGSQPSA